MSAQTATWAAYGLILLAGIVSQLAALRNPERASRIGRVVTWAMRRRDPARPAARLVVARLALHHDRLTPHVPSAQD